jgi:hypothetical protein
LQRVSRNRLIIVSGLSSGRVSKLRKAKKNRRIK